MNVHIHPAHVASLPIILRKVVIPPAALTEPEAPPAIVLLCAAIGRTAADVAALLFEQPMTLPLHEVFEAEIRQTIAAELLTRPAIDDAERQHMESVAWVAFDRRMERHGWSRTLNGSA